MGPVTSVRRLALLGVVGALALTATSCGGGGDDGFAEGSSPDGRLVVLPVETTEAMFATVSGTLGINDQGCFTLDDRVLVVGHGSQVVLDGEGVEVADVGTVRLGERASGGGGYVDGSDEVEQYALDHDLGDTVTTCQSRGAEPALTVLDPSG